MNEVGNDIHALMKRLFPICRSLTGHGVRETLAILKEYIPLTLHEVPSGTQVFDWTVPDEWNIRSAYIIGPNGEKIVDFKDHNLHVVGYSVPVDQEISLEELQSHLYSLPDQPGAIPYITSYYQKRWGFCLTHKQRSSLKPGTYRVKIDSTLEPGSLTYAELLLPGQTDKEIFLSTYICHPSMANNELSGPCVTTYLAKWLLTFPKRRYSYRIVFIPETIGSITYLSRNLASLQQKVAAGFVVTCIGDERAYSYLPSRNGHTLSDLAAQHVLKHLAPDFKRYTYLNRGSDERQYCSPGVDLPMATIMRSKYGAYPEYHTSLDDLTLVTPKGLAGGYQALKLAIEAIENNPVPKVTVLCEPQLGKRGLYPTLSTKTSGQQVAKMMNLLAYSDGTRSLLEIAEIVGVSAWELFPIYEELENHGLLKNLS